MDRRGASAVALNAALEDAYPELRRRTHLYVLRSPLAQTREEARAIGDDVLHEALERVLGKADRYDVDRPIHAWVMGFVANVILERKRSRRSDAARLVDEPQS